MSYGLMKVLHCLISTSLFYFKKTEFHFRQELEHSEIITTTVSIDSLFCVFLIPGVER